MAGGALKPSEREADGCALTGDGEPGIGSVGAVAAEEADGRP